MAARRGERTRSSRTSPGRMTTTRRRTANTTSVATPRCRSVGPDGSVYVTFDNEHSAPNGPRTQSSVYIATSADGGRSFGPDYLVQDWINPDESTLPNSEYRSGSYAVPGVDSHNRISVVWND